MKHNQLLHEVAEVWTPNFPRRTVGETGGEFCQFTSHQRGELIHNIKKYEGDYPGYVSVYSFPNGHPTEGAENIPRIDTLMIDFDVDKEGFLADGKVVRHAYAMHMNKLLKRLNAVAEALEEAGKEKYFRWSLSGFKGAHLYLDFPAIPFETGSAVQFRRGMEEFTDTVAERLAEVSGYEDLHNYIDVSSGWDLSRLTRLPNTIHEWATEAFEEERYCIPVTNEEMKKIGVQHYVKMTRNPRRLPEETERVEQERSAKIIRNNITNAPDVSKSRGSLSVKDEERYREYRQSANRNIELEDLMMLLKRKPCIWKFRKNIDMFTQGAASHNMEMQAILAMASVGAHPMVMHEFFKSSPNYDYETTHKRIREVLSRDYQQFNCSKILETAEQFCLKSDCKTFRDSPDLQEVAKH